MKSLRILSALAFVATALILGACSRSQHVTDSVSGPRGTDPSVVAGCPTLLANTVLTPDTFKVQSAVVPKFSNKVLRIHTIGDVAALPSIDAMGACATGALPSIFVTGGHATVVLAGTQTAITGPLTFGAFTKAPGVLGELLGTDAAGNSMHIIWPLLQGIGAGAPIVRVELRQWNTALVSAASRLDIAWDMTLQQDLTTRTIVGACARIPCNGSIIIPAPAAAVPCPLSLGAGGAVINQLASLPTYTALNGLRADVTGDVAGGLVGLSGPCTASATPTIQFTGGTGNMTLAGKTTSLSSTGAVTFGALLFPGIALEPGVVLATDANKNMLEIIWPQMAGLGVGSPIFRLQLKSLATTVARPGAKADVAMTFNAIGANGAPATFTVAARGLTIPPIK